MMHLKHVITVEVLEIVIVELFHCPRMHIRGKPLLTLMRDRMPLQPLRLQNTHAELLNTISQCCCHGGSKIIHGMCEDVHHATFGRERRPGGFCLRARTRASRTSEWRDDCPQIHLTRTCEDLESLPRIRALLVNHLVFEKGHVPTNVDPPTHRKCNRVPTREAPYRSHDLIDGR